MNCQPPLISSDFTVDEAVLADFTAFLKSKNIDVTDADLQANIDWVKESIRSDLSPRSSARLKARRYACRGIRRSRRLSPSWPQAKVLEEHEKSKAVASVSR
jgi:carboxyl-terminal processing protease